MRRWPACRAWGRAWRRSWQRVAWRRCRTCGCSCRASTRTAPGWRRSAACRRAWRCRSKASSRRSSAASATGRCCGWRSATVRTRRSCCVSSTSAPRRWRSLRPACACAATARRGSASTGWRSCTRATAAPVLRAGALAERLRASLPFALTGAQQRVFAQVREDLGKPVPMLRLVQGDVGSGKTVVAALAAMLAVEDGRQAALMAPTELLAEQHLATLRAWLEPLGVNVAWLAGKVTGRARAAALAQVADGAAQVVVGTHALMQEGVAFHDLALAIVDEQHRFGVHQRLALRDKGGEG